MSYKFVTCFEGEPRNWQLLSGWQSNNMITSLGYDQNRDESRTTRWRRRFARYRRRFRRLPSWVTPHIYNTFRYGMITLYVGTLFMVIGYHNPWITFTRYVGLVMVAVGMLMVGSALVRSFSRLARRITEQDHNIPTVAERVDSADSKQGLPSYDMAANLDLPTYEEAASLRLNPSLLTATSTKSLQDISPLHSLHWTFNQTDDHHNELPGTPLPPDDLEEPPPDYNESAQTTVATVHNTNSRSSLNSIAFYPATYNVFQRPQQLHDLSPIDSVQGDGNSRFGDVPVIQLRASSRPDQTNLDVSPSTRRRSLVSALSRPNTSAIVRSYSSSSFESPDGSDSDSDWDSNPSYHEEPPFQRQRNDHELEAVITDL